MEATGTVTPSPIDGSRTPARAIDQGSTGAHEVIEGASDAKRAVVDRVASGAHRAVDKIAAKAGQAAAALGAQGEQLKNAQARAMQQCRGYVRDHPATSIGIAVAAGFLLSRLVKWGSR